MHIVFHAVHRCKLRDLLYVCTVLNVKKLCEFNRTFIATENILKIEAGRLSKCINWKKKSKKTFASIVRQRRLEQAYK
jgi:hypothetical protein